MTAPESTRARFDPAAAAPEGSGIFGLPHAPEEARVIIIPVGFDATTSYRKGTARGPSAIFGASKQVDLFDLETGRPYEGGIAMVAESDELRAWNDEARVEAEKILAVGGDIGDDASLAVSLAAVNERSAKMNGWVEREATKWRKSGKIVGLIGGDHSTPFGAIAACAGEHSRFGILHFDAHADLRVAYEGFTWSHASIMHNVLTRVPAVERLVQVGVRDLSEDEHTAIVESHGRVVSFFDRELKRATQRGENWASIASRIALALPDDVYVSFDIDGLEPTLCPHTGTPVPGGLSFDQALAVIEAVVAAGKRIVGFDVNEVAPDPSGHDDWDGNVGARLLYKLIGWTLKSQRAR